MNIICIANCANESCRRQYDMCSLEDQLQRGSIELQDLSLTCEDYIEGIVLEFDRGFKLLPIKKRFEQLGIMLGKRLSLKNITHEVYRQITQILSTVGVSADDVEVDIENRTVKWDVYCADRQYTYVCNSSGKIKKF